ncbi:iron-containing alcohol dehydrogenase [Bacteroides sp.]|uniref:iron-containing alcohol dehydrogenase n=1 Tax=Bacteroides sp. TaxID=29523 RepID=UPI00260D13BC|nr:iron-containing alcohol dehydrogenase [Bacteroides sp.]MDD3040838.1 iron-containing alcohol dehydrogenase [Bacteroides sp.]
MNNFRFCVGTDILFGKNQLKNLPKAMQVYGKKVLLVFGGGSIKQSGLYDKLLFELKDFEIHELSGVEPNPRVETVRKGVEVCREKGIEVLLAVGGGSTIDCAKAIAAATFYEGDAWDMVLNAADGSIGKTLPVCTVLTLAATGSEMDSAAVVSNLETREKLTIINSGLLPKCSVLDPENTFSVPEAQTAAGSVDIMSHVMEVYFGSEKTFLTDRICEALLKTVIQFAPIALEEPRDFEARANLMWASSLAINGLCNAGKAHDWSCHYIEHELSAYYDITHGVGLAIVTPQWMRYVLNENTVDKFATFAVNVWNVDEKLDKFEQANEGIKCLESFFKKLAIPMTLSEVNIGETHFEAMAKHAVKHTGLNKYSYVLLNEKDIVAILKMCL